MMAAGILLLILLLITLFQMNVLYLYNCLLNRKWVIDLFSENLKGNKLGVQMKVILQFLARRLDFNRFYYCPSDTRIL